jgi:thiol reductant ABC exporter CydD subunit
MIAGRGIADQRLRDHAEATRRFIRMSVGLGCVTAVLVIAQAWLLASIVSRAVADGDGLRRLAVPLLALLLVVCGRAIVAWLAELAATRSSVSAKLELRDSLLEHAAVLGPRRLRERGAGELAVLATRGIDALDAYFSQYLPQLVLAAVVPAGVLVVIVAQDWISALIIGVTLPLIPVFMALVGANTRDRTDAQVRTLQHLGAHFLDVVAGLPTLKVFGRAKPQISVIRDVSERYRAAAVSTLRITFLSSLILELVATVSVALVAVAVGVRLLDGHLDLHTALLVLVLAPEAYIPLRQLGAGYHASAEGMAAADQAFAVLELPVAPSGSQPRVPDPRACAITVEELSVTYAGRERPALDAVSLTIEPGEVLALTGPSGCGKSTLLSVLLGFTPPDRGSVRIADTHLADLDPDAWRAHIAWVPQQPHLFAASIDENIRLGRPDATAEQVWDAIDAAGLHDVIGQRPDGLGTILGERGVGLSAGERQRVALARAFLRDAPLLLLDEPTAGLDGETEAQVLAAVARLTQGRTVVLVAHRPALAALADRTVSLSGIAVAV